MIKQLTGAIIAIFWVLLALNSAYAALPQNTTGTGADYVIGGVGTPDIRIGNGWDGPVSALTIKLGGTNTGPCALAFDFLYSTSSAYTNLQAVGSNGLRCQNCAGGSYETFTYRSTDQYALDQFHFPYNWPSPYEWPLPFYFDPQNYYVISNITSGDMSRTCSLDGYSGGFGTIGNTTSSFTPYMKWDPNIIKITYPAKDSTVNSLNFWGIERYISSETISSTYHLGVDYSDTSSSTFQYTDFLYSSILDEKIDTNIPLQDGRGIFTPTNVPKTYYARLRLTDANDITIATTTPISFSLVSNLSYFGLPSSTTSTAASAINCDANSDVFSYSLCAMFGYLFVPDPIVFTNFGQLWGNVKNKPPIGYFGAIAGALGNVGTSTAAYQLATVGAFAAYFSPIKLAFAWLLWFVFAFWVFNRLRHFQL